MSDAPMTLAGTLDDPEAHYVALGNIRATAEQMDLLLVVRKSGDWNSPYRHSMSYPRIVLAITEGEARYLHEQHRLDGWTPTPTPSSRPGDPDEEF